MSGCYVVDDDFQLIQSWLLDEVPVAGDPLTADELRLVSLWIYNGAPATGVVPGSESLLLASCTPPADPQKIPPPEPPAPGERNPEYAEKMREILEKHGFPPLERPPLEPLVDFATARIPESRTGVAPDGSDFRRLLALERGSMAQFELAPGETSKAVAHRSVEEIWLVLSGRGEMWRKQGDREETAALEPGVCLSIPAGTHFQFRSTGGEPLRAVAVTLPPWPGDDQASVVEGPWRPTVR